MQTGNEIETRQLPDWVEGSGKAGVTRLPRLDLMGFSSKAGSFCCFAWVAGGPQAWFLTDRAQI
jgi:hypothetical protein